MSDAIRVSCKEASINMSLSDKVVIVTGSSSGIGAAIAVKFTAEGAQVVITGRNQTKLKNVSEQCAAVGKPPLVIPGNISKDEDAKRLLDQTLEKFGKLDILINNAGIFRVAKVLDGNLMSSYDEIMNTNIRSVVNLTSLAAPSLVKTKGNIINISSSAATKMVEGFSIYSISKAALNHFTRGMALELADSGVRVNTISPGPVTTDIIQNAGFTVEQLKNLDGAYRVPLKRVSGAEEVADLALFLTSDKAVGITGADFVLDNGVAIA